MPRHKKQTALSNHQQRTCFWRSILFDRPANSQHASANEKRKRTATPDLWTSRPSWLAQQNIHGSYGRTSCTAYLIHLTSLQHTCSSTCRPRLLFSMHKKEPLSPTFHDGSVKPNKPRKRLSHTDAALQQDQQSQSRELKTEAKKLYSLQCL